MKFTELWKTKRHMIQKMWLNQFAFSLFGLFVATPFTGNICVIAGVFSILFYVSVVAYAILDDAQKDRITFHAGRGANLHAGIGAKYAFIAFLPSFILTFGYTLYSFISTAAGAFRTIYFLIVKYLLAGEILGIDVGLTRYTYDAVNQIRTTTASQTVVFMSDHGIFQLLFIILMPLVFALIYKLAFSGVISFNTTETKKK